MMSFRVTLISRMKLCNKQIIIKTALCYRSSASGVWQLPGQCWGAGRVGGGDSTYQSRKWTRLWIQNRQHSQGQDTLWGELSFAFHPHILHLLLDILLSFSLPQVFMVDQSQGTAQLQARHPLDCEERSSYTVTIAAVSCSGQLSQR